ncbi:MAG TPA: glycosyltransferase [Geminicoccaceae bacterium]
MILALHVLWLVVLAVHAPAVASEPGAREFVVVLALLGTWRCCWGLTHLSRALIYRRARFPALRRAAGALGHAGRPSHVYLVITSFRHPAETTARVFQAVVAEAMRFGGPVTIVASIVEAGDLRLIKQLVRRFAPPDEVRLVLVRRPALGRRHALACALRAVSRRMPAEDAAVLVMDGDTLLPLGTLERSLPFLRLMPEVDGITTDEDSIGAGGRLMQAWQALRAARRHQVMSSMVLSRRLIAMPGRMSILRARTATDADFIRTIEHDDPGQRRPGQLPLLAGTGGSAWLWLLQAGRGMLYLPDVRVIAIDHPSGRGFVGAGTTLMLRWSGDMLRTEARAIALGPGRIGAFAWWCLVGRRISMWTPLIGAIVVLPLAVTASWVLLWTYALWVGITRLIQCVLLLTARPRIDGLWPFLIYYGQIQDALVGIWILLCSGQRRWARPGRAADAVTGRPRLAAAELDGLGLSALIAAIDVLTNLPDLPPPGAGL